MPRREQRLPDSERAGIARRVVNSTAPALLIQASGVGCVPVLSIAARPWAPRRRPAADTLAWACLSSRLGIRVGPDQRPLVAHLLGRTLLLGAYHLVLLIPGA